jgi:hypothetical protein
MAALVIGVLIPTHTTAASLECPNTWQEKLPEMNIQTYKGEIDGIQYILLDNNLEGEENLYKAAPWLMNKIKSYGSNIIAKIRFEVSNSDSFAKIKKTSSSNLGFGEIDYLREDIYNGDYIRLSVNIEVKDCSPVTLYSNSRQVTGLAGSVSSLDSYISLMRNVDSKNRLLNFKEQALIKPLLKSVSETLSAASKVGVRVPVDTISNDELVFYFGWLVKPISNDGCLTPSQWGRTKSVVFNSFPCKFGLYGFHSTLLTERIGPFAYRKSPASNGLFSEYTFPVLVGVFEATGVSSTKAAADKAAADKAASAKKTTITCVKGKVAKKVTAVKPVCPSGYKKK